MADYTTNLNLEKPVGDENFRRLVLNDNMDKIDVAVAAKETVEGAQAKADAVQANVNVHEADSAPHDAGGTGTAITITLSAAFTAYTDLFMTTFIASASNAGAATTVNINTKGAKNLYKPNTTTAPNIIAGKAYTIWYDATSGCFFFKASAEGDAVATDVLAGKKFSNDNDNGLVGTIPSKTAATITPSGSIQTIAAGQYLSGTQTISAVTVPVANVLTGTTIAGQAGTMPNRAGDTAALGSSVSGTTLKLRASNGYRDGVDDNVTITDANHIPANIRKGVTDLGVTGDKLQYGTSDIIPRLNVESIQTYGTSSFGYHSGSSPYYYCTQVCIPNDNNIYSVDNSGNICKFVDFSVTTMASGKASNVHFIDSDGTDLYMEFTDRSGLKKYSTTGVLTWTSVINNVAAIAFDSSYIYVIQGQDIVKIGKSNGVEISRIVGIASSTSPYNNLAYDKITGKIYFIHTSGAIYSTDVSMSTPVTTNILISSLTYNNLQAYNNYIWAIVYKSSTLFLHLYKVGVTTTSPIYEAGNASYSSKFGVCPQGLFYSIGGYNWHSDSVFTPSGQWQLYQVEASSGYQQMSNYSGDANDNGYYAYVVSNTNPTTGSYNIIIVKDNINYGYQVTV